MANTPQAKKRIRRNNRRAEINGARVSRIRTFIKAVESALASGNKTGAAEALRKAQPELARGVSRGVVHKNTAARKISRLSKGLRRWVKMGRKKSLLNGPLGNQRPVPF